MKKALYLTILLLVVFYAASFLFDAAPAENQNMQIANPASQYCVEQGGRSEIRSNPDGSQYGVCITKDKGECDEWEYFRGGCVKNN